jgi:beta-lactamase superfamily II metal-dependent hydrolase
MTEPGGTEGGGRRKRRNQDEPMPALDATAEEQRRKAQKKDEAEAAAEAYDTLGAGASDPMPVPDDKKLYVSYVDAGQGDCTLIRTPDGRRIMIDCGHDPRSPDYSGGAAAVDPATEANERTAKVLVDAVASADCLDGGSHLDILVLTHADKDHVNAVAEALSGKTVGCVYYSGKYGTYRSGVANLFNTRGIIRPPETDASFGAAGAPNVKHVTCRPGAGKPETVIRLGTQTGPAEKLRTTGTMGLGVDVVEADGSITILAEESCTVSILASDVLRAGSSVLDPDNVAVMDGDQDGRNCGSVVVLVHAFEKWKLLFCGDATLSTEKFLVARYADRIADTDWLRVAHHGSALTSSSPAFIAAVRPRNVVISAGRQYSGEKHARWHAVKRYLEWFATATPVSADVPVVVWQGDSEAERNSPPPNAADPVGRRLAIRSMTPFATKPDCFTAVVGHPVHSTPKKIVVTAGGITEGVTP